MIKYIELSGVNGVGKSVKVDKDLYDELSKHSWHINNRGYVLRTGNINGKTTRIYMHRFILDAPKGSYVDHINGDRLDNRKENLRIATNAQNIRNSALKSSNSSGFKGVSWRADKNKWQAKITYNYRQKHLGLFSSKREAAIAYNEAAKRYHGTFAKINIIREEVE